MGTVLALVLWAWSSSDDVRPCDGPVCFRKSRLMGGDEQRTLPPVNPMYWGAVTSPCCHSCISSRSACGKGMVLQGAALAAIRLSGC